jgi:hypothetical protein
MLSLISAFKILTLASTSNDIHINAGRKLCLNLKKNLIKSQNNRNSKSNNYFLSLKYLLGRWQNSNNSEGEFANISDEHCFCMSGDLKHDNPTIVNKLHILSSRFSLENECNVFILGSLKP